MAFTENVVTGDISRSRKITRYLTSRIHALLPRRRPPTMVAMLHIGRCGSSVLADMLGQHDRILWDGEVFRDVTPEGKRNFGVKSCNLQNYWNEVDSRSRFAGKRTYGFEVKPLHLEVIDVPLEQFLQQVHRGDQNQILFLTRKNLLR